MRDRGHGSITDMPDGRKRARLPHALGRRSLGTYATEGEAKAVLDAAIVELSETPSVGLTLDAWALDVLDAREAGDHKRRTVHRDRGRWQTYVRGSLLGQTPLIDVSEADVRRWLASLRKQDGSRLAPVSVRNALSLVRVVLEAAREAGRIPANPARDVRLSAPARRKLTTHDRWTWLREDELDAVLSCDEIPLRARAAFATSIYAGLRAGELWGLRWEDVDLERGVLHVRHSFEDTPKAHAVREVPILAPLAEWLRTWRVLYVSSGVRSRLALVWPARDEAHHADGYDAGWAARDGDPERGWRAVAGIRRPVRFHDLRHTCASHLVQGTWAPRRVPCAYWIDRPLRLEEVRDWLGHEDITVTQRYAHLCSDAVRALVVAAPDLDTIGTRPEAAARIRTGDLRFTKPRLIREIDGGSRTESPACPVACPDTYALAVRALRAIERGDPRALVMATDALAAVVLEARTTVNSGSEQSPAAGPESAGIPSDHAPRAARKGDVR
jgi:integrase